MKRLLASAFLIGVMACAGCFTVAPPKIAEPEPIAIVEPKAPSPVLPDQVNAQNAQAKAQALSEELDFAQNRQAAKRRISLQASED